MIRSFIRSATLALLATAAFEAAAAPCPTTTVETPHPLPSAAVGVAYAQTFTASNANVSAFTFAITSGLPSGTGLAIAATGPSSATLSGTPTTAADYIVTATATDANGCSGGRVFALSVAPGPQTITFTSTAPVGASVEGPAYTVAATASSGLPVAFSIASASSSVCAISGDSVSFQSAGTCTILADQAGDANHAPAPQVQQSFAVEPGDQTITFTSTAPAAAVVDGPTYTVAATATSGLAVTFSIDASASAVCAIAGTTVSFTGAGTCVVNANQAGDADYTPAPQVQQSFAVGQASQSITFNSTPPSNAVFGGPIYTVAATASSGLPVAFTIDASASAVCAIAGTTVSFTGAGTCVVNANQAGDADYTSAPQVQQSFTVGQGSQTITFTSTPPSSAVFGGPTYTVAATASSGLPVVFTVDASASAVCAIAGTTVSFTGVGTCIVNANQAGSANVQPAAQVQQAFAVARADQTITFTSTAPTGAVFGGSTYTVSATASSGLAVSFAIDASATSVCSISGTTVSFTGAGTCVVNANQAGDARWNPAPQVQQSFAVARASQTISFTSTAPTNAQVGGTYVVSATATSGLPVAFTIDAASTTVCSIAGNTVTFNAAGTCTIDANQAGDANHAPAPQVQQSVTVSACITLAVGEVAHPAMPAGSTLCIHNSAGSDAEYTYLPINFATAGDATLSAIGTGIVAVSGPPNPPPGPDASIALAPLATSSPDAHVHGMPTPEAFDDGRSIQAADLVTRPQGGTTPLVVGQLIDLNAAIGSCGVAPSIRKGRVEAVTTGQPAGQPRLYAVQEVMENQPGSGNWTPAIVGGFATQDFQSIVDAFVTEPPGLVYGAPSGTTLSQLRTGAMQIAGTNLGQVTDVDNNGGVIVFFTRAMNEQSPPASSTVTPGTFLPRDLFASASCPGSNEGEILYMLMPDPTGSVNSNVRTVSFVYGQSVSTLAHHYAHLTNAARRLYVNNATGLEAIWLDEAIAWQMGELVFYNTSAGLAPRQNIALTNLNTGPNASTRVNAFNTYINARFGNDREWFFQLGLTNSSRRVGPLAQMSASSAADPNAHQNAVPTFSIHATFLRYMLDRKNTGDAALLHALANSTASGMANLQTVFNEPLQDWARDFLVAMYTDDAVAGIAPAYMAPSWNYRSVYGGLGGFPMAVNPLTNGTALPMTLRPGGGARYLRFGIPAGGNADLALTQGGSTPGASIVVSVVRTK